MRLQLHRSFVAPEYEGGLDYACLADVGMNNATRTFILGCVAGIYLDIALKELGEGPVQLTEEHYRDILNAASWELMYHRPEEEGKYSRKVGKLLGSRFEEEPWDIEKFASFLAENFQPAS